MAKMVEYLKSFNKQRLVEPLKEMLGTTGREGKSNVIRTINNGYQQKSPSPPIQQAENMEVSSSEAHPEFHNTLSELLLSLEEAIQHHLSPTSNSLIPLLSGPKKPSQCRKKWKRRARLLGLLNPHRQLSRKGSVDELPTETSSSVREKFHKVIEVCDVSKPAIPNELAVVAKHPH